jgi:cation diffusion facilitator CzcD-associated flavoprotein CzcO
MLQRSPTYFFCHPNQNELADRLRQIGIDEPTVHRVVRAGHARSGRADEALPDRTGRGVRGTEGAGAAYAGEDFAFEPNFLKYRVGSSACVLPRWRPVQHAAAGHVRVVTDTIDRFTERACGRPRRNWRPISWSPAPASACP